MTHYAEWFCAKFGDRERNKSLSLITSRMLWLEVKPFSRARNLVLQSCGTSGLRDWCYLPVRPVLRSHEGKPHRHCDSNFNFFLLHTRPLLLAPSLVAWVNRRTGSVSTGQLSGSAITATIALGPVYDNIHWMHAASGHEERSFEEAEMTKYGHELFSFEIMGFERMI